MIDAVPEVVLDEVGVSNLPVVGRGVALLVWNTDDVDSRAAEATVLKFFEANVPFVLAVTGSGRIPRSVLDASPLCYAQSSVEISDQSGIVAATDAFTLGAVNGTEPEPGPVLLAARRAAEAISELAPLAVLAALNAVRSGAGGSLEKGLSRELELFCGLFGTADMKEGTSAFLEKRKPLFLGE